jgi:hypothetical protein
LFAKKYHNLPIKNGLKNSSSESLELFFVI